MDKERIDSYSSEMSSWISKQGFFFQIFYGPRLLGNSANLLAFLGNLFTKIFVLCLIVGLIIFLKVSQDHTSASFATSLEEKIQNSLHAEEVKVHQLKNGTNSLTEVPNILIQGGEQSFFERLKIQNAEIDLGNFISRKDSFNVTTVICSKIELEAKLVPHEKGDISTFYTPLFNANDWFSFQYLQAKRFKCEWGYTAKTKGSITDAALEMTRQKGRGWIVKLTGGTFSYAWMKELKIDYMILDVHPDSFEIVEARFQKKDASFSLSMKVDKLGADPQISGTGELKNCKIKDIFTPDYAKLIHGTINSNFSFKGSPIIEDGLKYTFTPLTNDIQDLDGSDLLSNNFRFKHSIKLWRALTTLDNAINYKTYKFNDSDWLVELQGNEISIHNARLSNSEDDKVQVTLDMDIKEPTADYINHIVSLPKAEIKALLQKKSLRDKAQEILRMKGSISQKPRLDRADYITLFKTERHLTGHCKITLQEKSFQNNPRLVERFPVNPSGYRSVELEFSGPSESFTDEYTDELYKLGRN